MQKGRAAKNFCFAFKEKEENHLDSHWVKME